MFVSVKYISVCISKYIYMYKTFFKKFEKHWCLFLNWTLSALAPNITHRSSPLSHPPSALDSSLRKGALSWSDLPLGNGSWWRQALLFLSEASCWLGVPHNDNSFFSHIESFILVSYRKNWIVECLPTKESQALIATPARCAKNLKKK